MGASYSSFAFLFLASCGGVVADKPDAAPRADAPPGTVDAPPGTIDAAVDGPPAVFTPATLTGTVLWLDAGQNVTTAQSKVSLWSDSSGKNNNAAQANATFQPTLVSGVVNGKPIVRFNGSVALSINDSATLQWATDDFYIAIVASYTNSTTASTPYGMLLSKQTATSPYTGPSMWGNFPFPSLSSRVALQIQDTNGNYVQTSADAQNNGTMRLYVTRRYGGTNLEMRVNGVTSGAGTQSTNLNVSAPGRPMNIGGVAGALSVSQALTGDIAEIVAVRGTLTAQELMNLETYLKTKYGL